jgi:hypothetical protein
VFPATEVAEKTLIPRGVNLIARPTANKYRTSRALYGVSAVQSRSADTSRPTCNRRPPVAGTQLATARWDRGRRAEREGSATLATTAHRALSCKCSHRLPPHRVRRNTTCEDAATVPNRQPRRRSEHSRGQLGQRREDLALEYAEVGRPRVGPLPFPRGPDRLSRTRPDPLATRSRERGLKAPFTQPPEALPPRLNKPRAVVDLQGLGALRRARPSSGRHLASAPRAPRVGLRATTSRPRTRLPTGGSSSLR